MIQLAIDIGNTRTKAALFNGGTLLHKAAWEELTTAALEQLAYNQKIENAILSTTAKVPKQVEAYLREKFFYVRLGSDTPLPIAVHYQTPLTLGKDRIAAAAGAFSLYPNENALIIDAGTCITMDLINSEGTFLGGNISPGVEMRLKAMHHFTSNLPLVIPRTFGNGLRTVDWQTADWLGDSTESAVRNGGELGALLEVTAFMERCRRGFKPLRVIFTGGDADFFVKNIKTKIFAHSNLVLIGLNKILQHNVNIFKQGKSGK